MAEYLSKVQGLEGVCGIAADSDVLYLPNNVLRECGGILKDWILRYLFIGIAVVCGIITVVLWKKPSK